MAACLAAVQRRSAQAPLTPNLEMPMLTLNADPTVRLSSLEAWKQQIEDGDSAAIIAAQVLMEILELGTRDPRLPKLRVPAELASWKEQIGDGDADAVGASRQLLGVLEQGTLDPRLDPAILGAAETGARERNVVPFAPPR